MHQAVFADIEEAAAGATVPGIRKPAADVLLKAVEVREGEERVFVLQEARVNFAMRRFERLQLPGMIVQDSERAGKFQFAGASRDGERIFGIPNARAQN